MNYFPTTKKKPNFFIVGQPKAGTTALYDFLQQHPEIFMPAAKEPLFFAKDLYTQNSPKRNTLEKYLKIFENVNGQKAIGEASTHYFYSEDAAKEIKKFNSQAKIIILLREPVDFLLSYFNHKNVNQLYYNKIDKDLNTKEAADKIKYSQNLKRYLNNFPKKNILILIHEDFKKDNLKYCKKVFDFLNVDPEFKPVITQRNIRKKARNTLLSRCLRDLPLSKIANFFDKFFPRKVKNMVAKTVFFMVFQKEISEINPKLRRRLKKKFKPEVEKSNKLLNEKGFIKKDLIKFWRYDEQP